MSAELISLAVEGGIFQPRKQFAELAADHVPVDALTQSERFEAKALRSIVGKETAVGVRGPRGGGKSSLIAYVCRELPDTHMALRVPVIGADDPTSVNVMGTVALAQALRDLEVDEGHRLALERARADERNSEEMPAKIGGSLGGGAIPVGLHAELGTLREQLQQRSLAVDRLAGLERLISSMLARGRRLVFVLEDTEAALGGTDPDRASRFFGGPVSAFINELDASFLIAVQDEFASTPTFKNVMGAMALIELPGIEKDQVQPALVRIVESRLAQHGSPGRSADALLTAEAQQVLAALYEESDADLRTTLATLQAACELTEETGSELVGSGAVRAAAEDWRRQFRA